MPRLAAGKYSFRPGSLPARKRRPRLSPVGYPGVYYRSRYAHDLENWALFEPFRTREMTSEPIADDRPAFREALRILGLKVA